MEDQAIIALYFARDELAITQTDKKYGSYCYSIANRILCSPEDSRRRSAIHTTTPGMPFRPKSRIT